jgi:DNA-binding CsgD family transcriptional regulator
VPPLDPAEPRLSTPADDRGFRTGLFALLATIALAGAVDIVLDQPRSWLSFHIMFELAFVGLCVAAILYLWLGWSGARRGRDRVQARLAEHDAERDRWRRRATRLLRGLGSEIDAQFERWSLTPTERQVALLLLKGLGHREAAATLGRSERTVRQHAVSVYRKAGLAGRAELAAFFLEDLLLPLEAPSSPEAEQEPAVEARGAGLR